MKKHPIFLDKSREYSARYLKLYMKECNKYLDKELMPIQCLLIMVENIAHEIPFAHKDLKRAKEDMFDIVTSVFNELETKKLH